MDNVISTVVEIDASEARKEIIQLNAVASNGTKTLEERVTAKNKAVELQNKLQTQQIEATKQTISNLKIESALLLEGIKEEKAKAEALKNNITKQAEYQKALKNVENATKELNIKNKELIKSEKDLEKQTLALVKADAQAEVAMDKLAEAQDDANSSTKKLDDATGGLITKFKALATNPIAIFIALIVGLFKLLQNAIGRSEKATASFNIIMAKLEGVFNGLSAVLEVVVEFLGDKLVKAFDDPKQAIKDFGNFIVENLTNRIKSFLVLGEAIGEFFKGNFKKAGKLALDGVIQFASGVTNATDKITKFYNEAQAKFDKVRKATEALANAERELMELRFQQEKQMLVYQTLAEKQRQIRDDESRWIGDRIEANKRLGAILDKQLQSELNLAKAVLRIAQLRKVAEGSTTENLEKEREAQLKLYEIQERITGQRSEQLVNATSLQKAYQKIRDDDLKNASKSVDEDIKREESKLTKIRELQKRDQEAQLRIDASNLEYLKSQGELINENDLKGKREHQEKVLEEELIFLEKQKEQDLISEQERVDALFEQQALNLQTKKDALLENERLTQSERLAIQDAYDNQMQILLDNQLMATVQTSAEKLAIETEYNNRSLELTQRAEAEKRRAVNQTANAGVDALADVFGMAKEVEIARQIMNAPSAIANSFKMASSTYAPPLSIAMGALGAAATVIPIVKGLADIKKVRFPKSKRGTSGGGGDSSSGSGSSISASAVTSSVSSIANNNSARLGIDPSLGNSANANAMNKTVGASSQNIVFSENSYQKFQEQVKFKEEKAKI